MFACGHGSCWVTGECGLYVSWMVRADPVQGCETQSAEGVRRRECMYVCTYARTHGRVCVCVSVCVCVCVCALCVWMCEDVC